MLFFLDTIEELIEENLCPACVYGDESKKTYYIWFDLENYNSLPTMINIADNGLCRQHGWEISSLGNKLSTLNQFVANTKTAELKKLKAPIQSVQKRGIWPFSFITTKSVENKLKSELKQKLSNKKCPVCKTIEDGETTALILMNTFLKKESGLEVYKNSPSLCWRHLCGLINIVPSEIALPLIDIHIKQMEKLDEDFNEYFRKTDYRFSHEPEGEEQLAWLKSLKFYAGENPDRV